MACFKVALDDQFGPVSRGWTSKQGLPSSEFLRLARTRSRRSGERDHRHEPGRCALLSGRVPRRRWRRRRIISKRSHSTDELRTGLRARLSTEQVCCSM